MNKKTRPTIHEQNKKCGRKTMYGKTGLFNHIEVQIAIINSVYKVMVYRFGSNTPFNFRYFVNPSDAIKFADDFLEEYKWRL